MGNQTVFVLSNDKLDVAREDPQFLDKLFRAMDETEVTNLPAIVGPSYGMVMPYHDVAAPTLYLSHDGSLEVIGTMAVRSIEECRQVVQDIILRSQSGD